MIDGTLFFPVSDSGHQYDTPQSGKTHQRIDDSWNNGILAAKYGCNEIELEKADKTPVDGTDDDQYHCDDIQTNQLLSELLSAEHLSLITIVYFFWCQLIQFLKYRK